MAKPRIFLSSTCFDLGDARASLTAFLQGYGFEVLNSQLGSFGVTPKKHSHQACLDAVGQSDYLVLIIGGRRGGSFVGSEGSITNEEVKAALSLSIPVIAFVNKNVDQQRITYKRNPRGDFSHVVDDVRVFDFIDWVSSGHEDNWLHQFDNVSEIQETLQHQFAHFLQVYSQSLRPAKATTQPRLSLTPFPSNLDGLARGEDANQVAQSRKDLRVVFDALSTVLKADTKESAKLEQLKAIWVIARHGEPSDFGASIREDRFKASAWGNAKGRRVFAGLEGTKISGWYDYGDEEDGGRFGVVGFKIEGGEGAEFPGLELCGWVKMLVERYGSDEGLQSFLRLDMRVYSGQEITGRPATRRG